MGAYPTGAWVNGAYKGLTELRVKRVKLASRIPLKTKEREEANFLRKNEKSENRGWLILYTTELSIRLP